MKNKFLGKLILSGAALAACATTLVTSTFAWYTSNTEVAASGVTGESTANGSSLLLVSTSGSDGSYSSSVDIGVTDGALQPLQYTAGSNADPTFQAWGGKDVSGEDTTSDYIHFNLYFRGVSGANGVNVNLNKLVLTNTTTTLPTKDVLSTTGMTSGWNVSEKSTYTVDVLRTVNIAYAAYECVPNSEKNAAISTFKSAGVWNPESLVTLKGDSFGTDTGFNAHSYLNAVTGSKIQTTDKLTATKLEANTTNITLGTTPASTATYNSLHVSFYVFINGWDLACFDAVQDQKISLSLGFTSETPKGIAVAK